MLHTILRVVEILIAAFIALMVLAVAIAAWTRRGERRPDLPGVRTLATFRGGGHYVGASERQAEEQGEPVGEGMMQALAAELGKIGVSVTNVDQHESFAWSAHIERAGAKAYLMVGEMADGPDQWLLNVLDPSSGGPGPPSLLGDIHTALTRVAELRDITWHSRQCFDRGDEVSSAAPSPLDEAKPRT